MKKWVKIRWAWNKHRFNSAYRRGMRLQKRIDRCLKVMEAADKAMKGIIEKI